MVVSEGWYVGIDIGGTWVRLLTRHPDGRQVEASPFPVPDTYKDLLTSVIAMLPAPVGRAVQGVGCGIPGTTDGERALFVPALPWLEGKRLGPDLAAALQAPVYLGNDGQYTLLAEITEGAAAGASSAVLVAVGTGIGGAIMTEGRTWRGHHGSAGSWGWLPSPWATTSGGHGPFEKASSGTALSELAASVVPWWTGAELFAAARRREARAVAAVDSYAERLASGVAAIVSIIDPEVVVIGGGVSAAMDVLGPVLARDIAALASPDGQKARLCAAALGPRAGVVGSVLAAKPGALIEAQHKGDKPS